jgi:hypothetical protein
MGLFSRDEKIYVSSVVYQLGEELDRIPDVVKASVIGSKMKGENTTRSIKKAIIDGQGVKLRQAFSYARKSYYAGLPLGLNRLSNASDVAVIQELTRAYLTAAYAPVAVELKDVSLEYDTNYMVILQQQIETKYNYDFYDDRVHTSVFGIPVDSVLSLEALQDDEVNHDDQYGWRLTFTKPDTTTVTFDEWYDVTLFDDEDDLVMWRLMIQASFAGAPSVSLGYNATSGTDAQLNLFLRNATTKTSGTFPGLVLKKGMTKKNKGNAWYDNYKFYSKLPISEEIWKATTKYKTTKGYARRLGVDLQGLKTAIKESPDENQIDYVFVQPGTNIASPNQCAMEYHFNYFNRLRLSLPDNKPAFDAWKAKTGGIMTSDEAKRCPSQSVRIRDPNDENNCVNMEIAWRYMTYEVKNGTLTKPYETEVTRAGIEGGITSLLFRWGRGTKGVQYDFTQFYIRKRLTVDTYAELMICGLWHENYVYKGKSIKSGIWDAYNDKDGDFGTGFIVPLEIEVYMTLSGREQLQLAQEALHIIFNCYKVVKEKWYETGIFKVFMVIIAIVVIVISWGTLTTVVGGIYSAVSAAVGAVITSVTVAAAVAAVLTALIVVGGIVAVQLVAKEAGEWAAEQWGPVWGAIVSIAVTIALTWGMGLALESIGIAMAPMTLVQQVVMITSYALSTLSTYTQLAMEELAAEKAKWDADAGARESQQAELERLWEENFPEMSLPAQMWFQPVEKLDDWLQRTLGSTDTLVTRLTAPIEYLSEMTLTPQLR